MFKSKKGVYMKSNEELQSYIICLRKQLAVSLNDNRILKIKMHRLEVELQKKDAHIQNLVSSNKDFDIKKLVKQHGKGLILNMQKQIHILEEKLLQNEMASAVKVKSHTNSDGKLSLKRKESKTSMKSGSLSVSNKSAEYQYPHDHQSVPKLMKSKSKDSHGKRSSTSKIDDVDDEWKFDESCLNIIKMLKEQTNTEAYDNKSKNNQISYLLNKLKSFKKATCDAGMFAHKTESIISTDRSSVHSSSTLNPEINGDQSYMFRSEHNLDKSRLRFEKTKSSEERDENCVAKEHEHSLKNTNLDVKTNADDKVLKKKTPIEYVSDSEVSSDEEYWQQNDSNEPYFYQ